MENDIYKISTDVFLEEKGDLQDETYKISTDVTLETEEELQNDQNKMSDNQLLEEIGGDDINEISDDVLHEVDDLTMGKAAGYIHNVSPLKNDNYFDFQLQMRDKTIRAVCFSPPKRKLLDSCSNSKTPVKIKKFRLETKSNSEDLLMDDTVTIEEFPEIDFENRQIPANLTISMLKSICIGQLVTVKAKLASLQPIREVKNGQLKLVEGCLIDPTDCIKITIWQEHISQVQQGSTYIFKNIRLKKNSVTNEIYVNTAKSDKTTITVTDDFREQLAIPLTMEDYTNKTVRGEVLCLDKLVMYHSCCKCHKKVELSTASYIECSNCKTKQKQKACKKEWVLYVTLQHDSEKIQITLFDNIVQSILTQLKISQTTQELTQAQMTNIVFSLPEVVTVTFNKKTKAANSFII